MDDLMKATYSVCVAVVIVELLSQLCPDKFCGLVRGTAILLITAALFIEFFRLDIELDMRRWIIDTDEFTAHGQDGVVSYGIELLQSRLYKVLDTAGISVSGQENGITVLHSLDDMGNIEIDCVQVMLDFETDRERANALLQSILTQAIPLEVYVE